VFEFDKGRHSATDETRELVNSKHYSKTNLCSYVGKKRNRYALQLHFIPFGRYAVTLFTHNPKLLRACRTVLHITSAYYYTVYIVSDSFHCNNEWVGHFGCIIIENHAYFGSDLVNSNSDSVRSGN
jgi:hypothetical protein